MKMKKNGPREGRTYKILLPRSATVLYKFVLFGNTKNSPKDMNKFVLLSVANSQESYESVWFTSYVKW